jgi:hypothetical protein
MSYLHIAVSGFIAATGLAMLHTAARRLRQADVHCTCVGVRTVRSQRPRDLGWEAARPGASDRLAG